MLGTTVAYQYCNTVTVILIAFDKAVLVGGQCSITEPTSTTVQGVVDVSPFKLKTSSLYLDGFSFLTCDRVVIECRDG